MWSVAAPDAFYLLWQVIEIKCYETLCQGPSLCDICDNNVEFVYICNYIDRHVVTGQVVHTHVPLSSSSIIWYWPDGTDAL